MAKKLSGLAMVAAMAVLSVAPGANAHDRAGGYADEGEVAASLPPMRYRGDVTIGSVMFVRDVAKACRELGLRYVEGAATNACAAIGGEQVTMVLRNPCRAGGRYARELCHEIGHANGWPASHGR